MTNYSITLNFLMPPEIINKLRTININGNLSFDWRESKFCHCTLKAIALLDAIPSEDEFNLWISNAKVILSKQSPFKVTIKDVSSFPSTIFANVQSTELITLHKKLSKILPSSQPQFEDDQYVPHVSVAIINGDPIIKSDARQNFGEFLVKEIQLTIYDVNNLNNSRNIYTFALAETK